MFYIYEIETKKVVSEIDTDNAEDFEFDWDWEVYGATQSPAFGFENGLNRR